MTGAVRQGFGPTGLAASAGSAAGPSPISLVHDLKIVYWGPGRSGKTTNLSWLHARLRPELRGRLVTLDGPGERTLYFDCLPLELNPAGGPRIRLRLYTVPGQPRFRLTRRLVLQGVDGLVFVWDSRRRRLRADLDSLRELWETVGELNLSWERLPRLYQYNKQDLNERMRPDELDEILDRAGERATPRGAAMAVNGSGVLESLRGIASAALRRRVLLGAGHPERQPLPPLRA